MTEKVKPGAGNAGHANILISSWKPLSKNSLKGVFSAVMPSGVVYHSLMFHEREGKRWIGLPAKEWTDAQGERQFTPIIGFVDGLTANSWRDDVLAALDAYLEEVD